MMDTNEVIIGKIIENRNSNSTFKKYTLDIEEDNDIPSIDGNCIHPYKEDIRNNVNEASQLTNDCEIVSMDVVEIERSNNAKDDAEEQQQKSVELSNIIENKTTSSEKNQSTNEDLIFENLTHKDDDIYIIHEKKSTLSVPKNDKSSSLVSIAVEYGSCDSESDDSSDKKLHNKSQSEPRKEIQVHTYRQNKESSSEESYSDDDSTSSDSPVITESNESDSDNCSNKKSKGNSVKQQKNNEMKNELDDLPPIEDLKISVPEVLCDPLGEVAWMVEQLVVVKPKPGKPTLNLDTVLFIEKGQRALGKIFDVFGQVSEPHYCVRFNSSEHIKECDVKVGMTVYYCPNTEYTSLVFLHELMKIKGVDANADEPPEFSDDEEERAYYEQLKTKQANNASQTDVPFKRKRTSKPTTGWQSNHPWNRNTQKYRKRFNSRTDTQFSSMQIEKQSQHLWSQPYQNNVEQYGYGPYSLQPMQYMNQNFYNSHSYNEAGTAPIPLNPRIPFSACPRVPSGYLSFRDHPSSSTNVRFQNASTSWLPQQMPQVPIRMEIPWIPMPPPPPPPTSSSPDTT
ncbi:unnamed protein product [Xylocopa violacea]|uniref:H/ACA ribonucleoprotein complex non-core subunit NAF1 n=1 Tax=Xylocopa violacea TaxID=135666 RepID=A0ABP1NV25_XYLVO